MSAANTIPGARVSPRIANGCICWYEGDTFSLRLRLELEDQDGAAVTVSRSAGEGDGVASCVSIRASWQRRGPRRPAGGPGGLGSASAPPRIGR